MVQVRVVILADHPLEDIFIHDGDHGHDESHVLMDDLGLKRVRAIALFPALTQFEMLGVYLKWWIVMIKADWIHVEMEMSHMDHVFQGSTNCSIHII